MLLKSLLQKKKQSDEDFSSTHQGEGHAQAAHDDESNWLVSYADMMTLLCGFFIMLFSMATLDEPKYESMKEAVAKQFGGEYRSDSKELAAFATQVLEDAGIENEADVRVTPGGIEIIFSSTVFFDTLSSELSPKGAEILGQLINMLSSRQEQLGKSYQIVVEGHTDGRPVVSGIYPSNWELSAARAARVIRLFLDQGYLSSHLTAIGYADTRPELPHRSPSGEFDESALGKNRRVVIRVLNPQADSIPFPKPGTESVPFKEPAKTAVLTPPAPPTDPSL